MTAAEAEKLARARWFDFELVEVGTKFKGDWVAYVKYKEAFEAKLAAGSAPYRRGLPPPDAGEARGLRLVLQEYNDVARAQIGAARALAAKAADAIRRGDVDWLAMDCASGVGPDPDEVQRTKAYFREQLRGWQAALADLEPGYDFAAVQYHRPDPDRGLSGSVSFAFGPRAEIADDDPRYPAQHEIELWWSGQVMPRPNGPLQTTPAPDKPASRWRFSGLTPALTLEPHALR
ncbi:MAG: hypothetical protein HY903_19750 [Deltaproteobacteria bacterium]|nr:hypothetical protein [Deltaproteobacteria bacterium]